MNSPLIPFKFNKFYSKVLLGLVFFVGFTHFKAKAAEPLEVYYTFIADEGDLTDANISVEKDGKNWKSRKGDKKGVFDLEYQHEFVITFSKKGYQTKKIAISTKVPKDKLKDGFEPITIDVYIYKQYDDVNLVVFNQPVGRYAYLPDKDDFGYDMDYSSSILTQVKEAETKLKERRKKEKQDDKAQGGAKKGIDSTNLKKGLDNGEMNSEESLNGRKKNGQGTNGKQTRKSIGEEDNGKGPSKKKAVEEIDLKPNINGQGVVSMDKRNILFAQPGAEQDNFNSLKSAYPTSRSERTYIDGGKRVMEITITRAGKTYVYTKVTYLWGVFYFKNGVSITEAAFIQDAL